MHEIYVSSTTRSLATRLNEHRNDIRNGIFSMALGRHFYEHDIDVDWSV